MSVPSPNKLLNGFLKTASSNPLRTAYQDRCSNVSWFQKFPFSQEKTGKKYEATVISRMKEMHKKVETEENICGLKLMGSNYLKFRGKYMWAKVNR